MPIFPICNEFLTRLFPPVTGMKVLGLSLHSTFIFFVMIMHIVIIIEVHERPACYEMFMFMIVPDLVRLIRSEKNPRPFD